MSNGLRNLARLVLIVVASVWAASAIPTGGALDASPLGSSDASEKLLDAFEGSERALIARGREGEEIGKAAPTLRFKAFSGATLELEGLDKVNVLLFVEPDCARCEAEGLKLSTLSVVYYEEIYALVITRDGAATEGGRLLENVGGAGLIVGGSDEGDTVAGELGITQRPTLVVIGPTGTVDAMWTDEVPLKTLYTFFKTAYEFDSEGELPYEPFEPSTVQDG